MSPLLVAALLCSDVPAEVPALDVAQLAALPSDDARTAAQTFVTVVEKNDQMQLETLLPLAGVKVKGKRLDNRKLLAKVEAKNVRAAFGVGAEGPWTVDLKSKATEKRFGLFRGSGYGKTTVVVLIKTENGWMIDEVKVVDLGSP